MVSTAIYMMTKGILCTIDFSEASNDALKWAIGFSRELDLGITILYTYRLPVNTQDDIVAWKRKMEELAQQKFAKLEKELLLESGVKYEFKIEVGFMVDRVKDHTRKNLIRFLIMSKNMFTKSKEAFDDLIEYIKVPLVVIPDT